MERLIATRPVLYQGRMYEPGDALPAYDAKMVDAWQRAGSAKLTAPPPVKPAQDTKADGSGTEDGQDTTGTQDTTQDGQSGQADGSGTESAQEMTTGHLDPKQLERMTKAALEKLAQDMGVDISGAKNNAERAALIAAVPVQAPVNEDGGAQE